ncbi:ABC transporter permease [Candidatus Tisiphia endosymbiont of Nemotelus uliginosus]|uniref:ABC transporter permease n=1 Tax=Candidatus Tisiphia endosymbiont of Nemotelus uliginosus TaxID=3077926 RepID=UPI0035C88EE4
MLSYLCSKKYWQSIILLTQTAITRQNKDSFLGSLWGLIQPFVQIIIISYFFGFLLKLPKEQLIMNLVGALPFWVFIVSSLNITSNSIIARSSIIKKVVISRTIFPVSDSLVQVYTLAYSFVSMYIAFIILYPERFSIWIIFLPILVLPLIICVVSASIAFAFLTPYIRDVPQLLNLILNVVYWTIPIVYPYSLVPESKRIFFEINPVFIVIRPLQYLVTEGNMPDIFMILKSFIVAMIGSVLSYLAYRYLAKNVIYYV